MKNKPRRISYNGHRYTPKEILTDLEGYVIEAKSTRAEMVNGSSKDPNLRENLSQTQRDITYFLGMAEGLGLPKNNLIIRQAISQLPYHEKK